VRHRPSSPASFLYAVVDPSKRACLPPSWPLALFSSVILFACDAVWIPNAVLGTQRSSCGSLLPAVTSAAATLIEHSASFSLLLSLLFAFCVCSIETFSTFGFIFIFGPRRLLAFQTPNLKPAGLASERPFALFLFISWVTWNYK